MLSYIFCFLHLTNLTIIIIYFQLVKDEANIQWCLVFKIHFFFNEALTKDELHFVSFNKSWRYLNSQTSYHKNNDKTKVWQSFSHYENIDKYRLVYSQGFFLKTIIYLPSNVCICASWIFKTIFYFPWYFDKIKGDEKVVDANIDYSDFCFLLTSFWTIQMTWLILFKVLFFWISRCCHKIRMLALLIGWIMSQ